MPFIIKIRIFYIVISVNIFKFDILNNFLYKIYALIYLNCERFKKTAKKVFFSQFANQLIIMNIKETIKTLIIEKPLKLDCGQIINNFPLAYETNATPRGKQYKINITIPTSK